MFDSFLNKHLWALRALESRAMRVIVCVQECPAARSRCLCILHNIRFASKYPQRRPAGAADKNRMRRQPPEDENTRRYSIKMCRDTPAFADKNRRPPPLYTDPLSRFFPLAFGSLNVDGSGAISGCRHRIHSCYLNGHFARCTYDIGTSR